MIGSFHIFYMGTDVVANNKVATGKIKSLVTCWWEIREIVKIIAWLIDKQILPESWEKMTGMSI
jgi:hypothetical protein